MILSSYKLMICGRLNVVFLLHILLHSEQSTSITMSTFPASFASGLIFGSGLTLSGVASPNVIKQQFTFESFHMLLTFLSASAVSAVMIAMYNAQYNNELAPKKDSSYGWFGRRDGNLVGGAMLGAGMALTGACPGTSLVQAAAGVNRSTLLILSGFVSGIAFVKWKENMTIPTPPKDTKCSVMDVTGWTVLGVVAVYETLLLGVLALTLTYGPRDPSTIHPIVGGLLIGVGQAASLLLARKAVGVSSAYEAAGQWFWAMVEGKETPSIGNLVFAGGLIAGARVTMHLVPSTREALSTTGETDIFSTLFGGFLLAFGARIAGGCTSGHGISGMSAMGIGSFVTVASMFGSAIITAHSLRMIG